MQTKLVRIELPKVPAPTSTNPTPLETIINGASISQKANGFMLKSTFVFGTDLVLVFQKDN